MAHSSDLCIKSSKTLSHAPSMASTSTTKSSSNVSSLSMRFHQSILQKFAKSTPEPIRENFEDEVMSFFIHTADLSGAAKTFELSKVWAKKINQEFSAQFEEEIKLGLPQTAHFKGLDNDLVFHKNECGFRKFIILPLYETMQKLDEGFFNGKKKKGLKVVAQVEESEDPKPRKGSLDKDRKKGKSKTKGKSKGGKNNSKNKEKKSEKKGFYLKKVIKSFEKYFEFY